MAFRTEARTVARIVALVSLFAGAAAAGGTGEYTARHRHLHGGREGLLRIDAAGVSFTEKGTEKGAEKGEGKGKGKGKGGAAKHSRVWKYDEIQLLTLGPGTLRVKTYEDSRVELGRDRVYDFDQLPAEFAKEWYPEFRARLDSRFVAALADPEMKADWEIPVKLSHGNVGSIGVLRVGGEGLVYASAQAGESRTWRMRDVEIVASSGAFDLTVTTHERDFRFQLRQELDSAKYEKLWRLVQRGKGLEILSGR